MNWFYESYSATNILLFTERLPRYLKKRSNFITSKFAYKTNKKGRKKERRRRKQPPTKRQSNWNDCYIVCRNLEFVFRPIEFGTRKRKTIFIAICRSCVQVNLARRKNKKVSRPLTTLCCVYTDYNLGTAINSFESNLNDADTALTLVKSCSLICVRVLLEWFSKPE